MLKAALRVRELAQARGWDAQQLASQAGLDVETARRIFNGEAVELDLTQLGHLAQLLGVLPNELVTEVVEPQPSVADGAEPPRSIEVPVQGSDQIKKDPTDIYDPESPAQRLVTGSSREAGRISEEDRPTV